MLRLFIRLSALSIGLSYATTSCQKLQQSQLASINERINQMLSSIYTPPILPKSTSPSTTTPPSTEPPSAPTYEATPYTYSTPYPTSAVAPQLIYMSPPPAPPMPCNMDPALQHTEYSYPASNPFSRAVYPSPYLYGNFPPPPYTPVGYPPYPYPYPMKPEYPGYPPIPGYPSMPHPPYPATMASPPPSYHPPLPSPPPPYTSVHSPYPPLSPIPSYPTIPYQKPQEAPPQYQPV